MGQFPLARGIYMCSPCSLDDERKRFKVEQRSETKVREANTKSTSGLFSLGISIKVFAVKHVRWNIRNIRIDIGAKQALTKRKTTENRPH